MDDLSYVARDYAIFETDWGWMGAARSPLGLSGVVLPQPVPEAIPPLLGITEKDRDNPASLSGEITRFRTYLAGKHILFNDKLDLTGTTPFQRLVWLKTKDIPYGESRSYGWIATGIEKPGAFRAVGQALGRNPLPIVIPCHRVLASGGELGGFSGGLDIKRRLLLLEGIDTG